MALPADCWDLTVEELHRQAPQLKVVAIDLPGRRGKSGDLIGARIDDWVDSVMVLASAFVPPEGTAFVDTAREKV